MAARRWQSCGAIALVLWSALFLLGCGGGGGRSAITPSPTPRTPTPTPTATSPTPPPNAAALIKVEGPLAQDEAITATNLLLANLYIVDSRTKQFYLVHMPPPLATEGDYLRSVRWLDGDTLLLSFTAEDFRVRLDGTVDLLPPSAASTPTPPIGAVESPDGVWIARKESGAYTGLTVEQINGTTKFRLTNATAAAWSPAGDVLAVLGNVCVGFDLFVFDPATAALRNLSESQPVVFDFLWRPDGNAIAVDLIPPETQRIIGLIDARTGEMDTLVDYAGFGDFPLRSWSPDGARLLFGYNPGRGACEDLGDPAVPTPQQTNVEVLSQ